MKAKGTPWVIHTGGGAAGVAARLRTPVYVINLKNPQRLGSREVLVVMEQRQRRHGGRGSHHVLVALIARSVPHKVFGSPPSAFVAHSFVRSWKHQARLPALGVCSANSFFGGSRRSEERRRSRIK